MFLSGVGLLATHHPFTRECLTPPKEAAGFESTSTVDKSMMHSWLLTTSVLSPQSIFITPFPLYLGSKIKTAQFSWEKRP